MSGANKQSQCDSTLGVCPQCGITLGEKKESYVMESHWGIDPNMIPHWGQAPNVESHWGQKKNKQIMDSTLGPSPQCGITLGPKLEPHVTQRAEPRVPPSAGSAADRLEAKIAQASATWSLNLRRRRVSVHSCCLPGSAFRASPGSGLNPFFLIFILSRRLNDLPPPPHLCIPLQDETPLLERHGRY